MNLQIHPIQTDAQLLQALPVLIQLRPDLTAHSLPALAATLRSEGMQMAMLLKDGQVATVACYRISTCLAWGKHLYLYDLVTDEAARSGGCGAAMLDWLIDQARGQGCAQLHLDSGVQRFDAHRFYLRHRFQITSHHFAIKL